MEISADPAEASTKCSKLSLWTWNQTIIRFSYKLFYCIWDMVAKYQYYHQEQQFDHNRCIDRCLFQVFLQWYTWISPPNIIILLVLNNNFRPNEKGLRKSLKCRCDVHDNIKLHLDPDKEGSFVAPTQRVIRSMSIQITSFRF